MKDEHDLSGLMDIPDPFAGGEQPSLPSAPQPPAARALTRSQVRVLRILALTAALLYEAAWPLVVERRPDLGLLSVGRLAAGLGVPLLAAVVAFSALAPGDPRRTGAPAARVRALVAAAPIAFALLTLMTSPAERDPRFWRHALGCLSLSALLASVPLALALASFRRAFPSLAPWKGAALGVAAGALAAATMSVVCPVDAAAHVLAGHGGVLLLGALLGGWLGSRTSRA